jgi:hypothetical protein
LTGSDALSIATEAIGMRHRALRLLATLFLAALVFVPLLEKAHDHADLERGRPCAACVVAHHAAVASAPVVTVTAPTLLLVEASLTPTLTPVRSQRSSHSGRAPPASLSTAGI